MWSRVQSTPCRRLRIMGFRRPVSDVSEVRNVVAIVEWNFVLSVSSFGGIEFLTSEDRKVSVRPAMRSRLALVTLSSVSICHTFRGLVMHMRYV